MTSFIMNQNPKTPPVQDPRKKKPMGDEHDPNQPEENPIGDIQDPNFNPKKRRDPNQDKRKREDP